MKKIILAIALSFGMIAYVPAQIKIKDLPNTTVGTGSDYLLKDRSDGGSGATQKISVNNFLTTYSIVTTPNVIAGTGVTLTKNTNTLTISASGTTPTIQGVGSITVTGTAPTFSISTTIDNAWIPVPFNGANFTTSSGSTWVVENNDVVSNRYKIIGKSVIWDIYLDNTTITGSPTELYINIPNNVTNIVSSSYMNTGVNYNGTSFSMIKYEMFSGIPFIYITALNGGALTNGTNNQDIIVQLIFEIN